MSKKEEAKLAPELTKAFADSKNDDPRVRQYLALTLGRLTPPFLPTRDSCSIEALNDQDSQTRISAIWALGSTGDASVAAGHRAACTGPRTPAFARWRCTRSDRCRSMPATTRWSRRSKTREADVQWNAAIALARHGRHEGVPVLRRMLDRAYVERNVTRQPQPREEVDPVGEVMISGLRAIAALKESTLVGAGEGAEHRRPEPQGQAGGNRSIEDTRVNRAERKRQTVNE